jgi:hypothetical protein
MRFQITFDETLPVLVFKGYLSNFELYIIAYVITKSESRTSGRYPRIISDIGKHLERGARLFFLFAELGNCFPTSCSTATSTS